MTRRSFEELENLREPGVRLHLALPDLQHPVPKSLEFDALSLVSSPIVFELLPPEFDAGGRPSPAVGAVVAVPETPVDE